MSKQSHCNHVVYPSRYGPVWAVETVSSNNRVIDTYQIMVVYDHERGLDMGRYKSFGVVKHEHHVRLSQERDAAIFVNWIAQHAVGKWSLCVEDNLPDWVFSFENPNDAVMFKLVFG